MVKWSYKPDPLFLLWQCSQFHKGWRKSQVSVFQEGGAERQNPDMPASSFKGVPWARAAGLHHRERELPLRGAAKKNVSFWGYLSQMCLPTHPPQGFCEIWEYERWNSGQKGRFSGQFGGVLRGLDLVWESATPPTHIFFGSFPYYVFRGHPEGKITQVQLLL